MLAGRELGQRACEGVALESLECRGTILKNHADLGPQAGGWRTCKPAGGDVHRKRPSTIDYLFAEIQVYFQSVRLDALDSQGLMERGPANFEIGMPCPRRILGLGRNVEDIESVFPIAVDLLRVELSFRCVNLQDCRMAVGNIILFVLQNHRDMERVPWPPDASLSVDESLQPLFQGLSADIEPAQGFLLTFGHFQVAGGSASFRHHNERLAGKGYLCHSVSACLGVADLFELVAVDIELSVEDGICRKDVAHADPDSVTAGEFGDDSEI